MHGIIISTELDLPIKSTIILVGLKSQFCDALILLFFVLIVKAADIFILVAEDNKKSSFLF